MISGSLRFYPTLRARRFAALIWIGGSSGLFCSKIFEQNELKCQAPILNESFLKFGNHFILIFLA